MTPEAQRIAIAEACGWERQDFRTYNGGTVWKKDRQLAALSVCRIDEELKITWLPDYLNDLNAMHEAEKVLSDNQMAEYIGHIRRITRYSHDYWIVVATATQRAEAFLRTLGKWEDGK